jgi:hypothetical protein
MLAAARKSAAARKLKVFTSRENVTLSREALRNVLADGKLVLRPDAANARFEGTPTLSHEEFLQEKQIDPCNLVAGHQAPARRRRTPHRRRGRDASSGIRAQTHPAATRLTSPTEMQRLKQQR